MYLDSTIFLIRNILYGYMIIYLCLHFVLYISYFVNTIISMASDSYFLPFCWLLSNHKNFLQPFPPNLNWIRNHYWFWFCIQKLFCKRLQKFTLIALVLRNMLRGKHVYFSFLSLSPFCEWLCSERGRKSDTFEKHSINAQQVHPTSRINKRIRKPNFTVCIVHALFTMLLMSSER